MKKLIYAATIAAITLSSCSDDKHEPNTYNITGDVPIAITPLSENGEPTIGLTSMKVSRYMGEGDVWRVNIPDITLPNAGSLTFTTPDIHAESNTVPDFILRYLSTFDAETGQTIRNFNCYLINSYLRPGDQTNSGTLVTFNFKVGADYAIASFPRQAYYGGTTVTSMPNTPDFTNPEPKYFVKINMENRTAELTIYNAKFAETMPMALSAVNIKGLTIKPSREYGYIIEGANIIPTVGTGDHAVEYPQYTFNKVEIHPTNAELTNCEITYTVADRFNGRFNGSYWAPAYM